MYFSTTTTRLELRRLSRLSRSISATSLLIHSSRLPPSQCLYTINNASLRRETHSWHPTRLDTLAYSRTYSTSPPPPPPPLDPDAPAHPYINLRTLSFAIIFGVSGVIAYKMCVRFLKEDVVLIRQIAMKSYRCGLRRYDLIFGVHCGRRVEVILL
jgi:hypothetical protein